MPAQSDEPVYTEPKQTRYSVEALLNSGIQPFGNWDEEMLKSVAQDIRRTGHPMYPVLLTVDERLFEGHQRLHAYLLLGRKMIDATDVRVCTNVTDDNALDWAIKLNIKRRHEPPAELAALVRRLQRERHWSQGRIAAAVGRSQGRISQLLAEYPDPDAGPAPDDVIDVKGNVQSVRGKQRSPVTSPAGLFPAWSPKGKAYKSLRSVVRTLGKLEGTEPMGPMDSIQANAIAGTLEEIIDRAHDLQDSLTRAQGARRGDRERGEDEGEDGT